jgi:hypothetical protein
VRASRCGWASPQPQVSVLSIASSNKDAHRGQRRIVCDGQCFSERIRCHCLPGRGQLETVCGRRKRTPGRRRDFYSWQRDQFLLFRPLLELELVVERDLICRRNLCAQRPRSLLCGRVWSALGSAVLPGRKVLDGDDMQGIKRRDFSIGIQESQAVAANQDALRVSNCVFTSIGSP